MNFICVAYHALISAFIEFANTVGNVLLLAIVSLTIFISLSHTHH